MHTSVQKIWLNKLIDIDIIVHDANNACGRLTRNQTTNWSDL